MFLLKKYIKFCLFEARKTGETAEQRYENELNKIQQYVDKGFFFHLTDDYKLQGVNVQTEYTTPIGIYFYPLVDALFDSLIGSDLPFAGERKYVLICKANGNIITTSEYSWTNFKNDYEKFTGKKLLKTQKYPADWQLAVEHPMSALLYLVYDGEFDSKQDAIKATKNLLKLGYSGLHDDLGLGVIHPSEPMQAVIFSSKFCEIIDTVNNPMLLKEKIKTSILKRKTNKFLSLSAEEQLQIVKSIAHNDEYFYDFFETIYKNNNGRFDLSTAIKEIILATFPTVLKFVNITDDMFETLAQTDWFTISEIYRNENIPDEFLQYCLDNNKNILLTIFPFKMSEKFLNIMSKSFKWDDDTKTWKMK